MSDRVQRLATALMLGCALAVFAGAGVAAAAGASPHAAAHHHPQGGPRPRPPGCAARQPRVAAVRDRVECGDCRHRHRVLRVAAVAAVAGASTRSTASASTQWCSTQWTGSVTVDLGRVRTLNGFGLTLGAAATTALVNFSVGNDPTALQPVPEPSSRRRPPGKPVYWPLHGTAAGAVRQDRRDRQRRHAALHRGVPRVRADAPIQRSRSAAPTCPSSPRRRQPARTSPTAASPARRCRSSTATASTMSVCACGWTRRRATATWLGPDDGQRIKRGRRQALPGHPLLGLLGRPPAPGHPRRVAGPGPGQLTATVRGYTRWSSTPSRPRARRSTWCRSATRSATGSCGRSARSTGPPAPAGATWRRCSSRGGGAREGNPSGHRLLVMLHFDEGGNNAHRRLLRQHEQARALRRHRAVRTTRSSTGR